MVILDPGGMVAELAATKIFLAKDGVAITLVTNAIFLAEITRRRAMQLLRDAGKEAREVVVAGEGLLDSRQGLVDQRSR